MQRRSTEPYLSTYLHRKGGKLGLPISGTFELTARCNFRCPMCYVHLDGEQIQAAGQELTARQWIDLAQEAKDQGMVFVLLTGGEPFLRKDFFEIYHALKQMGLLISINSNGSLLEGEILRELLEDPPLRINISLYGGCRETYRNMCGQDAFDHVVTNIRALKEAGVDVSLNLSITQYNRQDVERIFNIAQELGVHIKASSYMYPSIRVNGDQYGTGNRLSAIEAAKCSVAWDRLRFTEEEYALRVKNIQNLVSSEPKECSADLDTGVRCRAGHSSFWMSWNGRMMSCGMLPTPSVNVLETGFKAAWECIRAEVKRIKMPTGCVTCQKQEVCGVCAAVCVTETGTFEQVPRYMCRMTDEIISLTCGEEKKGGSLECRLKKNF